MEQGGENWLKWRNGFLVKIVEVVVGTIRIVKMKEHLPCYRQLSRLCIRDRVVVDSVVQL